MDVGCRQEALCPVNFQTLAQVGLEQLVLRSLLLPSRQESSYTRLQSFHFFSKVMTFVAKSGKEQLKTHVGQSMLPLFFHVHDENQQVAKVGFSNRHGHLGRAMLTPRGGSEHPQQGPLEGRSRGVCCQQPHSWRWLQRWARPFPRAAPAALGSGAWPRSQRSASPTGFPALPAGA